MERIAEHLLEHGVKPTSVRMLVWKEVSNQHETFTLNDAERWMPYMDRSSIFRALRLFTEHHLLHEIDDGTGYKKYCVCRCADGQHLNHIHFTCTICGQTYCLEDYHIPAVSLPRGFVMEDAEFVIKGVCAKCFQKK